MITESQCSEVTVLAEGLKFPEGPVSLLDGSVLVSEIAGGDIIRVAKDGQTEVFAKTGGGPNGMAIGPDGALYVCNNGGNEYAGTHFTATGPSSDYDGGSIQRVTFDGKVEALYTHCRDRKLSSPNDIVFDALGGFYFTDMGKRHHTHRDNGGLYYALPDGSRIVEVVYPLLTPNGVGLSPDEKTVYVSDTETSRLFAFDIVEPGVVSKLPFPSPGGARLVCGLPGFQRFDSMAVDAEGNVCIGTLMTGHVTVVSPEGNVHKVKVPDTYPTNLCFDVSGEKSVFVTFAAAGQLVRIDWDSAGLPLPFSA